MPLSVNQNGFRKGRNTIDHISTLTSIVETRKLKGKSTFTAFIDFKKAYDSINRTLLFTKLNNIGVSGCMFKDLLSVYKDVKCCVRLNGFETEWFPVDCVTDLIQLFHKRSCDKDFSSWVLI